MTLPLLAGNYPRTTYTLTTNIGEKFNICIRSSGHFPNKLKVDLP